MLVSDKIAHFLNEKNINKVYLYPGGTVAPLINSLNKYKIEIICFKNEQGAGYAAIGAAKVSGKPSVVIVTSGPGVTNLITPIADSYFDSTPLIVFTGQVGTSDINLSGKTRQTGFQEIKTTELTKCITKFSEIASHDTIENTLNKAYEMATGNRPGPVLIDLPMDVQKSEWQEKENIGQIAEKHNFDKKTAKNILELLSKTEKPLILAGNGVYLSKTTEKLRIFAKNFNLPVVSSLPGIGTIPTNADNYFGFVGHTGKFFANLALKYSDFVLVLGSRLDVRQTGSEIEDFVKNKTVVKVDVDSSEIENGRIKASINLNSDLNDFFDFFDKTKKRYEIDNTKWFNQLSIWKKQYNSKQFYEKLKPLSMYNVVGETDNFTKNDKVIITTGVGTHQHIAARFFTYNYPNRMFLTSAGHGAMGFDIPTCIGAVMEKKDYTGIVFVGDGSFQMNVQELATIKQYNLPIKIFVFDNKRLGLVSQFQKLNWNTDPTTGDKINPDFAKIASSYGIQSFTVTEKTQLKPILEKCFGTTGPAVVNCMVTEEEDVLPMLLGGQKLNQMYPFNEEV